MLFRFVSSINLFMWGMGLVENGLETLFLGTILRLDFE